MGLDCSKLTKATIAAVCNKIAASGAEDDAIIINFDDIDKTDSVVTENVISSIVLKGATKGYNFTTFGKSFNDAGVTFNKGTYMNTLVHTVPARIFIKNENVKKFANGMIAGARVVVILKNKESGNAGDVKYEAYGWDNGLELSDITSTLAMADGVVYDLSIASSDTAQEATLPKSIFVTDLETTEIMIHSLVA